MKKTNYQHLPTTKIKPCTHLRFDFNLLHQQHLSGTLLTSGWNLPDLPPVAAVLVPSRHVTCVSQGLRFGGVVSAVSPQNLL